MTLADAAASGPPYQKRPNKIDAWLEGLPETERAAALKLLDPDSGWDSQQLRELLRKHDLDVAYSTIALYRKALRRAAR